MLQNQVFFRSVSFLKKNTKTPDFTFLGVKSGVYFTKHWFSMFIAVRTGLEPVTPCVTGMYSNQLN